MEDITVDELKSRMDRGEKILVIDVREPYEVEEFSIGGISVPLGTLPQRLDEFEEYKNSEIVVHCRSGARSANAKAYMNAMGYTGVRNLLGGMMEWQSRFPN